MTYKTLLEILLSNNIYNKLKLNEKEIFELIPELETCKGFNQKNIWHIYDVYEHILHVISGVEENKYLRLSALFHDIGKPKTYKEDENGVGHFYNHWNKSIEIFKKYIDKLELTEQEDKIITNLIFYHDVNIEKMKQEEIKKMINKIGIQNLYLLFSLKKADLLAQSPEFHYLISNINQQKKKLIKKY